MGKNAGTHHQPGGCEDNGVPGPFFTGMATLDLSMTQLETKIDVQLEVDVDDLHSIAGYPPNIDASMPLNHQIENGDEVKGAVYDLTVSDLTYKVTITSRRLEYSEYYNS